MRNTIIISGLAFCLLTLCSCVVVPVRPAYYVESPAVVHVGYWHHY